MAINAALTLGTWSLSNFPLLRHNCVKNATFSPLVFRSDRNGANGVNFAMDIGNHQYETRSDVVQHFETTAT